jgi:hypothetical protein
VQEAKLQIKAYPVQQTYRVDISQYMRGNTSSYSSKEMPIQPIQVDFNEIKTLFDSLREILEENRIVMEEDCKVSYSKCNTEPLKQSIDSIQIQTERIKTEYDKKYNKLLEKYIQEKYTKYEESKI